MLGVFGAGVAMKDHILFFHIQEKTHTLQLPISHHGDNVVKRGLCAVPLLI